MAYCLPADNWCYQLGSEDHLLLLLFSFSEEKSPDILSAGLMGLNGYMHYSCSAINTRLSYLVMKKKCGCHNFQGYKGELKKMNIYICKMYGCCCSDVMRSFIYFMHRILTVWKITQVKCPPGGSDGLVEIRGSKYSEVQYFKQTQLKENWFSLVDHQFLMFNRISNRPN